MKIMEQKIAIAILEEALLRALDLKDRGTSAHSYRVCELSVRLGNALGLSENELLSLRSGALLHDIGKIGIPDFVLLKPGTLSSSERELIQHHSNFGADLINPVTSLKAVIPIVRCHHEKWDGTGYPNRLSGEQIPYLARICAVAEVFDSLVSDQIYKPAWPITDVLLKIQQEGGSAFDPFVSATFAQLMSVRKD